MRVQAYQPNRRSRLPCILAGCMGLVVLTGIACAAGLLIALKFLPGVAMQAAGFKPAGETNNVFQKPVIPPPTIIIQATVAWSGIMVDAGQFGRHNLSDLAGSGVQVALGNSSGDMIAPDTIQATIGESGLLDACRRYTPICNPDHEPIRNVTFDLRPGGVIVNGELRVPQTGLWQRAGIVMRLTGTTLQVIGVDVNGALFDVPPGELSNLVAQASNTANDLLNRFAIETGGTRYRLTGLYMDDTTLTVILR